MVDPKPLTDHLTKALSRGKAGAKTAHAPHGADRSPTDVRRDKFQTYVPFIYWRASFADLGKVVQPLTEWLESNSPTLLLVGGVGTGKTHAAWATLREAVERGSSASGVSVPDLLDDMRPKVVGDQTRHLVARLNVDVLLLDDLGGHTTTDWALEQLWRVLDRRTRDGQRQIVTTNCGPEELDETLGLRITSRLLGGATVVKFDGPDQRKTRW